MKSWRVNSIARVPYIETGLKRLTPMRGLTVAHSSRILDSDLARISEKCNLFVTCNPCSHEPTSFVRITFIRMESNRFVCMRFLFSTSRRRRRRRRRRGKAESVELVISYR